jgi:hypothetical protein
VGELPIGHGVVGVSILLPSGDFMDEGLLVWDAAIEALGRKDAEFGLGHIEPTAMLWSVMPFEPFEPSITIDVSRATLMSATKSTLCCCIRRVTTTRSVFTTCTGFFRTISEGSRDADSRAAGEGRLMFITLDGSRNRRQGGGVRPNPPTRPPRRPIPKPAKSPPLPESRVRPGYATPAISAEADAALRTLRLAANWPGFAPARWPAFTSALTARFRQLRTRFFFKIEYFDPSLEFDSEDRPIRTNRRASSRSCSQRSIEPCSTTASIYALQSWTVQKTAKCWFIKRTDHDESWLGQYSSATSACLRIARQLKRELISGTEVLSH